MKEALSDEVSELSLSTAESKEDVSEAESDGCAGDNLTSPIPLTPTGTSPFPNCTSCTTSQTALPSASWLPQLHFTFYIG